MMAEAAAPLLSPRGELPSFWSAQCDDLRAQFAATADDRQHFLAEAISRYDALGQQHAAERLRDALLRRPWAWQGESLRLTVSTGVAAWRGPHDEVDLLLKRADAAMYRAKSLGRDRFEFDQ
jgi:GGDEF domain-containing protein